MKIKKIIEIHKALGPRVLVRVDEAPEAKKLKSSVIAIVEKEQHVDRENAAVDTGTVIDIGSSAFIGFGDNRPWVNLGDRVTFLKHAGAIRKINGCDCRILNDSDLLTAIALEEIEQEQTEETHV